MNFQHYFASFDISWANGTFAVLAALASYVVLHGALVLFRSRLSRLSEETAHQPVAEVLKETLAKTSKLAMLATACLIGLSVLDLPPPWSERVRHLWFITLGVQFAVYLHRAVGVGARRYFGKRAPAGGDQSISVAHTLIVWAAQTAIWIVFVLALLANLGINVSTFIASLGIGGIAVALAVQNILGDLFASLSIAVDKPFEVGDAISVAGVSGTVEQVGLKTTRIRAYSGEQIVIGNAELLKNTVSNFKRMHNRRVQFSLNVNPATPATLAREIPGMLQGIVERQQQVRFDRAHLKNVDQERLEFEVVYFVLDADYNKYMDCQQAVLLDTMQGLADLGVATDKAQRRLLVQETLEAPANDARNREPDAPRGSPVRSFAVRP